MVTHACKLCLPQAHPTSVVSSFLFESTSRSLALMCSDSSVLLHHPISVSSSPSSSSASPSLPPTLIPPTATSACFLRLHHSPDPAEAGVVFLAAGPHRSSVLLRAWILRRNDGFAPAQLNLRQRDRNLCSSGVVLDLTHGFSIKMAGSVNVFVVHSPSAKKIWVLSARLTDSEDGQTRIDLMKSGVLECTVPICSVFVSSAFLILGEELGVRIFPLRLIVKGRASRKDWMLARRKVKEELNNELSRTRVKNLKKNGLIGTISGDPFNVKNVGICCNGELERPLEVASDIHDVKVEADRVSAKHKTVRLRQDSGEVGSFFVAFKVQETESPQNKQAVPVSLKTISVHSLGPKSFLILDSVGDVHLLNLHGTVLGSEVPEQTAPLSKDCHMWRLEYPMKAQMLAVLPDASTRIQTVWVSDGCYSVHVTSVADVDTTTNISEGAKGENEDKQMQISVSRVIFTSEKIHAIIPYAANGILILGQENIFAYAVA